MNHTNTGIQYEVLDAVKNFPDLAITEIADLLNKPYGTIRDSLRHLEYMKKIYSSMKPRVTNKGAKEIKSFYIDTVIQKAFITGVEKSIKEITEPNKTIKLLGFPEDKQKELEELRLWKQRAIMRFPELDVDPLILIAREMLAKHYPDQKQKNEFLCGHMDKRPSMLAMIELLESQGK